MTLVLVTSDETGNLSIVADTLFGEAGRTGSEIGPKIFLVPICISDFDEGMKVALPHMGFAFAGNVLSGQFTQALANTCLQNLAAPTTDIKPDVQDVASFYATCAVRIHEERRRHLAIDTYGFDGLIFGYSQRTGSCKAYHFKSCIAADGTCIAPIEEVVLEAGIPFAIGSGARAAKAKIEKLRSCRIEINPFSLMYAIINDVEVPSVGGEFQAATASETGVEFCPTMLFVPLKSGGLDADFSVMGINIDRLGMVAGYIPIGNPMMAQHPDDMRFMSKTNPAEE